MKIVAVSFARMDSVRFPGKCLAPLAGKPLIQHTVNFARALHLPLYVLTRDLDLMGYVERQCPVLYEPTEYLDTSRNQTYEMMQHCSKLLDADLFVLLQPTQPVRDIEFVNRCLQRVLFEHLHYTRVVGRRGENATRLTDIGLLYTFSRKHLVYKQRVTEFVYDGSWFDIDTPDDLARCETWLQS
jgi:CMP-2-keto-3-deoxyoctulosonic acid synthetase